MNTLKKANKPKFFKDETKEQMVRIIREQSGLKLPAPVPIFLLKLICSELNVSPQDTH